MSVVLPASGWLMVVPSLVLLLVFLLAPLYYLFVYSVGQRYFYAIHHTLTARVLSLSVHLGQA